MGGINHLIDRHGDILSTEAVSWRIGGKKAFNLQLFHPLKKLF